MNRFLILALAAVAATPAFAEETTDPAQPAIDLAFGVAVTTDYISRGATQTDGKPAVQAYIEASYNIFYVGVWGSNVSFGGARDTEFDIYGGIRPEFGDLSFDLGYAQYVYPTDPTNYGEFYAKASYAFTEMFAGGVEYYRDPFNDWDWAAATAEISGLPYDLVLSGQIGTDFGSLQLGTDSVAWDAGISRTFADIVTADLRYHDSNLDPARIVFTLSVDNTLSSLMGSDGN